MIKCISIIKRGWFRDTVELQTTRRHVWVDDRWGDVYQVLDNITFNIDLPRSMKIQVGSCIDFKYVVRYFRDKFHWFTKAQCDCYDTDEYCYCREQDPDSEDPFWEEPNYYEILAKEADERYLQTEQKVNENN